MRIVAFLYCRQPGAVTKKQYLDGSGYCINRVVRHWNPMFQYSIIPLLQSFDRAPAVDKASRVVPLAANSSQETIRHTGELVYRCFLPDLTGFTRQPLRRAQPSTPLTMAEPQETRPRAGIRPRYSGLRVQGTASSPSSTIKLTQNRTFLLYHVLRGFASGIR